MSSSLSLEQQEYYTYMNDIQQLTRELVDEARRHYFGMDDANMVVTQQGCRTIVFRDLSAISDQLWH